MTAMNFEGAKRIRESILAHPELSQKEVLALCGVKMAKSSFHRIYTNLSFHDPAYTPPSHAIVCTKCGLPKNPSDFYFGYNKGVPYRRKICKTCHHIPCARAIKKIVPLASVVYKRPASIDCAHVCPVCGMGAETADEALYCCRKAVTNER